MRWRAKEGRKGGMSSAGRSKVKLEVVKANAKEYHCYAIQ